jgi:hypothetical protein
VNWNAAEETFAAWTPSDVRWSEWAKPVAFVNAAEVTGEAATDAQMPRIAAPIDPSSAIVVDLPGAEAVHAGLLLAERGFWPVPLFNGTSGPMPVIDILPITRALVGGAERLRQRAVSPMAAPAFLLDSRRKADGVAIKPGVYDNRWVTLPQDFPSAALLASRGITAATLIRRGALSIPPDLAHVLRRWQDQGMTLRVIDLTSGQVAENAIVPKPSGFKLAWYAAIALFGLRRNNVGGFGAAVPEQTSGGGYG